MIVVLLYFPFSHSLKLTYNLAYLARSESIQILNMKLAKVRPFSLLSTLLVCSMKTRHPKSDKASLH